MNDLVYSKRDNYRDAIIIVENYLSTLESKMSELPVRHYFCNGMYARELFIPAGIVLTGAIHKTEHLCVMYGDIEIQSEDGGGRYTGYQTFVSKPGAKRLGYTFSDTYFTTFHPTPLTDVDELEKVLLAKTYKEFEDYAIAYAKEDYKIFVLEYGFDEDKLKVLIENEADQIQMPAHVYGVEIKDSVIHGQGLFATTVFEKGQVIAPARINNYRTPAGRFTNHAPIPNAKYELLESGDLHLVATAQIEIGDEILLSYWQAAELNGYKKQGEV